MSNEVYRIKSEWHERAWVNSERRKQILRESEENPERYWREQAQRIEWFKPFEQVKNVSYHRPVHIEWYKGGELNVSTNCIDRHLKLNGDKVAYIWVPEDISKPSIRITYKELADKVGRFANVMKTYGVKRGDRVTIYMPMILEAVYAMLACARLGAIHSVVFGGFSPHSLADRIRDCESDFVITADEGVRGGKPVPLKANVDAALKMVDGVRHVLVVEHTKTKINWVSPRDICYAEAVAKTSPTCPAEKMQSEDPLFILYTSGSTGKPKGVLHTTAGYLIYASLTHEIVFDYHPEDVYWCAADIGWVTGHSYIVYGPLANGATSILYEGLPTSPTPARMWQIVDQFQVNTLYTAPTLIRALMREGTSWVKSTSRKSLKLLGSVGEPINPEAWNWYYTEIGDSRCPIVDTWWQTETGGIVISPLPGATELKPGSATYPLFGVQPVLLNDRGEEVLGAGVGNLCLSQSWPGQMRTIYKDHTRFEETYFSQFAGRYYTGDECRRDADGYYWIIGRADDVINVSGHRLGTAEIESALITHSAVAESAVVGCPHELKGQGIYAFVTLKNTIEPSASLRQELIQQVRKEIGAIAAPDFIQWAPALPKTRSGKIMRRILKKIAANDTSDLGDISTLADSSVVENLITGRNA